MRLRKGGNDFSAEETNRAGGVVKADIAEHHLAKHGVDAGLFPQADEIVPDRSGRTSNPMADTFERREIARINILQHEFGIRAAPEKVDGITPARIGSVGDRACRIISLGNDNVSGDSYAG